MAKNKSKNKKNHVAIENPEVEVSSEADEILVMEDVTVETSLFLQEDADSEGFLPDVDSADADIDESDEIESNELNMSLEGSELEGFESAEIDESEFVEEEQAESIIESILFASDRPVSLASIREVFKGTNIKKERIRRILDTLAVEYAGGRRGISLEEVTGGYQLRTKIDNMNFLKRTVKSRPFKLSGPALETLSIVAYKQPVVKNEIDQIRGVESGHLLRALMEKGLCNFEGKAELLPGKPMQYGTTRRFLEIFGLRNIKELPTLSQIDELLPEGIGDEEDEKPTLSMVTDSMSEHVTDVSYSQGEEELGKIENELSTITTSSDFFEQEKIRQKLKKDADKAQDIRDALVMGEAVTNRDKNWLAKYEEELNAPAVVMTPDEMVTAEIESEDQSEDQNDELPFYEEADSEPEGLI
jgi:segregation and condensation protein B